MSTEFMGPSPGRATLPPVNSPRFLALNELRCPGTIVSLVNALLSATRWMMSSGAMTYPTRHSIRKLSRSWLWENANLNLIEDVEEDVCTVVSSDPRHNEQERAHTIQRTRLNEHSYDGLAQSTVPSHPHGIASLPDVQDEPDDNHNGEEDVECD